MERKTVIKEYKKVFKMLGSYDSGKLKLEKIGRPKFVLTYEDAKKVIGEAKRELKKMGISVGMFGKESGNKLETIIVGLAQTFGGKELYPTVGEKAANLLYFILKNHPFIDGNKKIGALLFLYYLEKNKVLLRRGKKIIDDNTLITLILLMIMSNSKEKDNLIKITTNFLK
jgi:prophage maintenance system killer protein